MRVQKIDNFANTDEKAQFFSDLPGWTQEKGQYTRASAVESEINKLIGNFNRDYTYCTDVGEKRDLVFLFILDLVGIHPFSDGNGRVAGILLDLYLDKLCLGAIGLKSIVSKDKLEGDRIIFLVQDQRNPKYLYDLIEKLQG